MGRLSITLFGRFEVHVDGNPLTYLYPRKTQELLSYLLLNANTPQSREKLAGNLYNDAATDQARKSLRQTLWQLQTRMETDSLQSQLLCVDQDYIRVNRQADVALDLAEFQQTYDHVCEIPGHQLQGQCLREVQNAVRLYRGDLLEGWYQDWCLTERERLQNMLLKMLYKLMAYHEIRSEYETGLTYGERVLSYDPACERAHRQMMRLSYLDGDRTGALHQYERCVIALRRELGVEPSERTVELYKQIRADRVTLSLPPPSHEVVQSAATQTTFHSTLGVLAKLRSALDEIEDQLRHGALEDSVTT